MQTYDIIIGNPPFGGHLSKEERNYMHSKYEVRTNETASLFMELGLKLAGKGGVVAFIIPKAFLYNTNYKSIRDFVTPELIQINDLGIIFENVKIETCIIQLLKGIHAPAYNTLSKFKQVNAIMKDSLSGTLLSCTTPRELMLRSKILNGRRLLQDIAINKEGGNIQHQLTPTPTFTDDHPAIGGRR